MAFFASTVLLAISVAVSLVSGEKKVTSLCYGLPTYTTIQKGPWTCRIWQPNWASETMFEITYQHCQEVPTLNVFIRNFYGYDEINTYFNPKYKSTKVRLFTGVVARIDLKFKVIKGNKKLGIRSSVRILVLLVPDHRFSPVKQQILTGVFYTDMKDDCSFLDLMELHVKIFLAIGLLAGLVFLPITVYLCKKWRLKRGKGDQKKTFCVWFFKCDQGRDGAENIARDGFMLQERNGTAPTDRLI